MGSLHSTRREVLEAAARGQVSMSQRQQQHSAVQHAVRQALSPESSLRRSSTTYTVFLGPSA